jgi:hypothetical protein
MNGTIVSRTADRIKIALPNVKRLIKAGRRKNIRVSFSINESEWPSAV